MSSPDSIRKFSQQWLDLFEWFEDHPREDKIVECGSPQKAVTLRFEFYRARRAASKDEGFSKLYHEMNSREAILDCSRVVFRSKEGGTIAEILAANLKE